MTRSEQKTPHRSLAPRWQHYQVRSLLLDEFVDCAAGFPERYDRFDLHPGKQLRGKIPQLVLFQRVAL